MILCVVGITNYGYHDTTTPRKKIFCKYLQIMQALNCPAAGIKPTCLTSQPTNRPCAIEIVMVFLYGTFVTITTFIIIIISFYSDNPTKRFFSIRQFVQPNFIIRYKTIRLKISNFFPGFPCF